MKSPPPMPPPPPPSYQESLIQMQHANNEISNHYDSNVDNQKYSNRPSQFSNAGQNKYFNNLAFPNENPVLSSSIPSSSSNDDMRQFLKAQQQQQTNTSNKRGLAQYLSNQQPYKNMLNSEFLRHNSPVNNFIAQQNYTSTKRPATNFTSDIEKELSDLTLTIEREMERQMEDKSEYFGLCAKCNKGLALFFESILQPFSVKAQRAVLLNLWR